MQMLMGRLVNTVGHSKVIEKRFELLTARRSCTIEMNVNITCNDTLRIGGTSLKKISKLIKK
jgi:hypothetical protein